MDIGMLWFDNNPKTLLSVKIQSAADYYNKKYGKYPNLCYVNPCMLSDESTVGSIHIRPFRPVLPGHLWIGMNDTESLLGDAHETAQMGLEVSSGQE